MNNKKGTVFIVDDEEPIRKVLNIHLTKEGYKVIQSPGGKRVYEDLKNSSFDLIISDIRMPDVTGVQVLEYVKENFKITPVIMLTGFVDIDNAVEVMKKGAFDYITKPVKKEDLIATVQKAFKHKELLETNIKLEQENKIYQDKLEKNIEELRIAKKKAEDATKELEIEHMEAEEIGKLLLKAKPNDTRLNACVCVEPCSTAGGDRAGFIVEKSAQEPQEREWLAVFDASGHGKGAAKFQEVVLGSLLALLAKGHPMEDALVITNMLMEKIGSGRFIVGNLWRAMHKDEREAEEDSLWIEEYNIGQHFVIEVDKETGEAKEWEWPSKKSGKAMMMRFFEDGFDDVGAMYRKVIQGSRIITFTDGISEANSPDDQLYSTNRLKDLCISTRALPPEKAHLEIVQAVKRWTGGLKKNASDEEISKVQMEDDITVAIIDV